MDSSAQYRNVGYGRTVETSIPSEIVVLEGAFAGPN
jgi:hypothetical protein